MQQVLKDDGVYVYHTKINTKPAIEGTVWFLLKVLVFLYVYVWFRATLPRFRYDQLMDLGWRRFIPLALANIVVTAVVLWMRAG